MKLRSFYVLLLALIFLSFIIVMIASFSNITAHASTDSVSASPRIIIDAGHGGEDGGAEVDGVLEKDINLSIASMLADILRVCGYEVIEVRDTDISVYTDGADTLREKKKSDLNNRVRLFNSDPRNVVVSIHQNRFDNPKYSGAQLFYSVNNENSAFLADCIRTAVVSLLQKENTRELKPAGNDIYILDQSTVPAVIAECGFLSNERERKLLLTPEYQQKLAYAIAMGVIDYCRQK